MFARIQVRAVFLPIRYDLISLNPLSSRYSQCPLAACGQRVVNQSVFFKTLQIPRILPAGAVPVAYGQDPGLFSWGCSEVEARDVLGNGGPRKGDPGPLPPGVVETKIEFGPELSSLVRIEDPPIQVFERFLFKDMQKTFREADPQLLRQLVPSMGQAGHGAD